MSTSVTLASFQRVTIYSCSQSRVKFLGPVGGCQVTDSVMFSGSCPLIIEALLGFSATAQTKYK